MKLRRILYWTGAVVAGLAVTGYAILASLDLDDLTAVIQAQVKEATGRDLVIAGPVDLNVLPSPSVDLRDLRFANSPWGSRADMVTLRQLEVEVDFLPLLTGDIVVQQLVLVEPDILLETNAEGGGNWEFGSADSGDGAEGEAAGAESGEVVLPDVHTFAVRGGRLTVRGPDGEDAVRLDLSEASGLVPDGGGARSLTLLGSYNDIPFRVEGTFGNLREILSGAVSPLDLTVAAAGAEATVKGAAGDLVGAGSAKLQVAARGESLAALAPLAVTELPDLGPYEISGDFDVKGQRIEFSKLSLRLADSDLAGAGSLDLAGERPMVTADLVSESLDLTAFTEAASAQSDAGDKAQAQQGGQAAPDAGGRIFSTEPLPFDALALLDAKLNLSSGQLRVSRRMVLNDVKLSAELKDARLSVDPLQGLLAGGALAGSARVEGAQTPPALRLALKGGGIDFSRLLQEAEISDQVDGELALDVALAGQGDSPHALASSLDGHVQAVSQDGTIDNALLRFLSAGLGDITGPLFGSADNAELNCIIGHFDIADGQATSRALVLDSGTFAIAGRGGLDLEAERVSLAFDTETSQPSLASLAVPFKVIGPMDDPSILPDPIAAAGDVVGTVGTVAETGGNIVAGAVDTLGSLVGTGPIIGKIGSDQSLCGEAMAAIGQAQAEPASSEVKPAGGDAAQQAPEESTSEGVADDVGEAAKELGRGIEKGLKSLFGN